MLILYNPISSANRKPVLPMSLLALGALLEDKIDYTIVDGNLVEDPLAALDRLVRETGADILGVTVMPGPQLIDAAPVCRRLKERHPELTIVWGGYFPTQHHEACLRSGYVDYVVRACGEFAFRDLVEALRSKGDLSSIPSLAFRDGDGHIQTAPTAPVPAPDSLPDYPYHRLEMARYPRKTFMGKRTLSHHSSYGCPFKCDFCAVGSMTQGKWLAQSAERLAGAVRTLVEQYNADAVEFFDNSFFIDEKRVVAFARAIIPLKIGWWAEARIDSLARFSDETWTLLKESGLKMAFMGAESGSDEVLQRMNKGGSASTEKTLFVARQMGRFNIIPEFSFVLGNPPEPEQDLRRTFAFIRKVKQINPCSEIILYMYTPVPSQGALYGEAQKEGFRFPETLEEWLSPDWREFSQRREIHVPWVRDALRRKVRNFECVLNAFYPTATNPRLQGVLGKTLRVFSAWRYWSGCYGFPLELRVLQKLVSYQRPETSGL